MSEPWSEEPFSKASSHGWHRTLPKVRACTGLVLTPSQKRGFSSAAARSSDTGLKTRGLRDRATACSLPAQIPQASLVSLRLSRSYRCVLGKGTFGTVCKAGMEEFYEATHGKRPQPHLCTIGGHAGSGTTQPTDGCNKDGEQLSSAVQTVLGPLRFVGCNLQTEVAMSGAGREAQLRIGKYVLC